MSPAAVQRLPLPTILTTPLGRTTWTGLQQRRPRLSLADVAAAQRQQQPPPPWAAGRGEPFGPRGNLTGAVHSTQGLPSLTARAAALPVIPALPTLPPLPPLAAAARSSLLLWPAERRSELAKKAAARPSPPGASHSTSAPGPPPFRPAPGLRRARLQAPADHVRGRGPRRSDRQTIDVPKGRGNDSAQATAYSSGSLVCLICVHPATMPNVLAFLALHHGLV
eukprot:7145560-Prymnesium_polylepis.1